ncbi:hypothetical protein PCASD_16836 [Puccinia coronata f. sp. avenae]|uniref:Uncharacterized protein n=1 Tax=Puccinia coronata f. sp. avenae TaxID=200324 RepID=A0A2N5U4N9_9BASI|nr:hypothetical protein PCASD_16836 [Puccinia coronata f. sp. avenae]
MATPQNTTAADPEQAEDMMIVGARQEEETSQPTPVEEEDICPSTPPSPSPEQQQQQQQQQQEEEEEEEEEQQQQQTGGDLEGAYLNDLPSLTPSKLAASSVSDSDSDSIPERFTDDESEPAGLLDALSLMPSQSPSPSAPAATVAITTTTTTTAPSVPPSHSVAVATQRTPASQSSLASSLAAASHISLSEPAPPRHAKIARKRSLSALVALRYRGGKVDEEIGDEERGLLALDLDTYINSGEPEIPETRALPPSALFPTLSMVLPVSGGGKTEGGTVPMSSRRLHSHPASMASACTNTGASPSSTTMMMTTTTTTTTTTTGVLGDDETELQPSTPGLTISLHPDSLLVPTPRSEWPFGGGTGPGKTSRGFIPGRCLHLLSSTTPTTTTSSNTNPLPSPPTRENPEPQSSPS